MRQGHPLKFAVNGVIWYMSSSSSYNNKQVGDQTDYYFGLSGYNYYLYLGVIAGGNYQVILH